MWGVAAAAILAFSVAPGVVRTPMSVQTEDGVSLHAVEYRSDAKAHRRTLVLIGDGIEGSSSSTVDTLAEALFLSGLDVVTWDRRGTGHSGGLWDYGASDDADVMAVFSATSSRTFGHQVGLLGIGSGGVAALQVFKKTAQANALAIYGVGLNGVPGDSESTWHRLNRPGTLTGRWLLRLRGVRVASAAPAAPGTPEVLDLSVLIAKLGRRPLMVAAGGRDPRVPAREIQELFRAAQPPKEWVFAPSADDTPPVRELAPRLEDFFRRRLK